MTLLTIRNTLTRTPFRFAGFLVTLAALGLSPACGDKAETDDDDDGQAGSSNQDQLDALEEKLDQLSDRLEDQEAELEAAKKAREAAERALAAAQEALENAASPEEIEAARKALEDAQAAFDRAQEDLEAAQADIDKLKDELDDAKEQLGRGPLYAMTLRVQAPTPDGIGELYYLITTPTLDEGTLLSPDQGIENVGRTAFGLNGYPAVWFEDPDDTSPTMERWDLRGNDFVPPNRERIVSFANLTSGFVNFAFGEIFSPALALVAINNRTEFASWNPTTMELMETVSMNIPNVRVSRFKQYSNGTIVACGGYWTELDNTVSAGTAVLGLNANATEILTEDEWEGISAGPAAGGPAADGSIYFSGSPIAADGTEGEPCLLRTLPGVAEFDRDFGCRPIADLVEGASAAGLEPGTGERVRIVDDWALLTFWRRDDSGTVRFYRWDLGSDHAEQLSDDVHAFVNADRTVEVDGRIFFADERSNSLIYECVSYDENQTPTIDQACVDSVTEMGTPYFEITKTGIKPAFTVGAAVYSYGIVRVR